MHGTASVLVLGVAQVADGNRGGRVHDNHDVVAAVSLIGDRCHETGAQEIGNQVAFLKCTAVGVGAARAEGGEGPGDCTRRDVVDQNKGVAGHGRISI